jgi:D-alanine-D-alanine ligase
MKAKKIGVLMGGMSSEREISIKSGEAVLNALKSRGYDVVAIDADKDVGHKIEELSIDVAFIALHGKYGEDGSIQGLLEMTGIPYTGSGLLSSALCMDKSIAKIFLEHEGIRCAKGETYTRGQELKVALEFPLIVKPACEGSTIGISIVEDKDALNEAVQGAFQHDEKVLIEELIKGRELTVSVLDGRILPIIEIKPKDGFYDYKAKYEKGMTEFEVPASLTPEVESVVRGAALRAYEVLGCSGVARVDIMLDSDGLPFVLEVNTVPGMTELSLLPMAAECAGISYEDLAEEILLGAGL